MVFVGLRDEASERRWDGIFRNAQVTGQVLQDMLFLSFLSPHSAGIVVPRGWHGGETNKGPFSQRAKRWFATSRTISDSVALGGLR